MRKSDDFAQATGAALTALQAHSKRDIADPQDVHPGEVVGLLADLRHLAGLGDLDIQHLWNLSALVFEHEDATPEVG